MIDGEPVEVQLESLRAAVTRLTRDLDETRGQLQQQGIIGASSASLSVGSVGFQDNSMRLSKRGIEILTESQVNQGFIFLKDTFVDPTASSLPFPRATVEGLVSSTQADQYIYARGSNSGITSITTRADDTTGGAEVASVTMVVQPAGLGSQSATLELISTNAGKKRLSLASGSADTAVFGLASNTADPTFALVDGDMWYRSDTDLFRVRANGATQSLAYAVDVTNHTGDTADAHDASAISILDAANDFTATDVEGALAELQSDAEAHLADTADAHDASAISVLDTAGNFTGTDVEAVLAELATAGGGMSLIVKAANETVNNTTTLQDDDHLLFAVAASEKWQFEGLLVLEGISTADFKYTFVGPTGAVGAFGDVDGQTALVADANVLGSTVTVATPGDNDYMMVRFWGAIVNGANAGNLKLQWAQNAAIAADTVVAAGSYIKYQVQ